MQIRTTLKALFMSAGLLSLVACSTMGGKDNAAAAGDDSGATANGAMTTVTSGIGDDGSFGANGNAKALQVGNQHYYFDFDKDDVRDVDMASIKVQANYLATHANAKILLTGNTDERGSREYNIALGSRRAASVEKILESDGVNANQITTVSYGAEKPVALGHDEASYALNRRVDLIYQTSVSK